MFNPFLPKGSFISLYICTVTNNKFKFKVGIFENNNKFVHYNNGAKFSYPNIPIYITVSIRRK